MKHTVARIVFSVGVLGFSLLFIAAGLNIAESFPRHIAASAWIEASVAVALFFGGVAAFFWSAQNLK